MKVIDQLYDKISTTKIDELAAEQCASLSTLNPDYGTLAGRIIISNHQKNTNPLFSSVVEELYYFYDIHGNHNPLVSLNLWTFVKKYATNLNNMIVHGFNAIKILFISNKNKTNSEVSRKVYKIVEIKE